MIVKELSRKLKFKDEELELVYRRNVQLKQEVIDCKHNQMNAENDGEIQRVAKEKQRLDLIQIRVDMTLLEERCQAEVAAARVHVSEPTVQVKVKLYTSTPEISESLTVDDVLKKGTPIKVDTLGLLQYDLTQSSDIDRSFQVLINQILDDYEFNLDHIKRQRDIIEEGDTINSVALDAQVPICLTFDDNAMQ